LFGSRCGLRSSCALFRCANCSTRDCAKHGSNDGGAQGTTGYGSNDRATQSAFGRTRDGLTLIALILILIVHVSLPKLWDMTLCLVRLSVNIGRSSSFLSQICLVELHEHETHVLSQVSHVRLPGTAIDEMSALGH